MSDDPNDDGWGQPVPEQTDEPPTDDYEVGYRKPPKHTRWSKGTSGNPKGPTKKNGTVRERIQTMLHRKVTTTGGKALSLSDAILQNAFKGLLGTGGRSIKSSIELFSFLERFDVEVGFEPTPGDERRLKALLLQFPATKEDSDESDESE